MKITYVCKKCGSKDIFINAQASWDEKLQDWTIEDVYWDAPLWCDGCEDNISEGDVEEIEIEDETKEES